jgi:hypothetical protein
MSADRDRLARVLGPAGPEITCEACFEHLDRYVELERSDGADAAEVAVPGMRAHLVGCPACSDDHTALHTLLEAEE